MDGKPSSLTLA